MASETIVRDVYNFLKGFPPFDLMTEAQIKRLAQGVKMQYYAEGEKIFSQGGEPLGYFCVVHKGSVQIVEDSEGQSVLIDKCDEGDIFGVRASIAHDRYIANAIAEEETLLYTVPMDKFQEILEENPKVALFLASGFASGVSVVKGDGEDSVRNVRRFLEKKEHFFEQKIEIDTLSIDSSKKVIDCRPSHTIREAAKIMSIFNVGSILITDEQKRPLGIITDSDFRRKVVAVEEMIKDQPVTEIMSHPVKTIPPDLSVAEVMLKMVSNRLTHLVVTEDGTPGSPAIGIASQRDILIAQGNNPSVLAKQILNATQERQLAQFREKAEYLVGSYLEQEVGIPFISNIITEINDVLILKATQMAEANMLLEGYVKPQARYCWLSLGSEGRREQLLRTDQDNALIYENPAPEAAEATQAYYLEFAKRVTNTLIACGFVKCPADMMASNPQWCQPVAGWHHYFHQWITQPDPRALMNTTIFFDFRPVAGEESLADDLKQYIFAEIEKNEVFLSFLAKNALQNPPPLSFFRSFIVEKGGTHKDEFDIKARAMMPLTDAARVLAYEFKLKSYGSTFARFEEVARLDKNLASICESAAMAYEILIRQRAIHGLKNKNSGRYINPDHFNKLERQTIRSTFKTIEKLQQILEVRYRLNLLR
ncbi:MAG: DUF294 nucleotidyltransferase-like domain-containing protein [Microscillaceae bacterium]